MKSTTFRLEDSAWLRGVSTCSIDGPIVVMVELPFLLAPISIWSRKLDAQTCLLLLGHFGKSWIAIVDVSTSCAETKTLRFKSILLQAFMPRPNGIPWRG